MESCMKNCYVFKNSEINLQLQILLDSELYVCSYELGTRPIV